MTGTRALSLHGRGQGAGLDAEQGRLEIYSLADNHNPILSLKHDRIRCTGKMGKWLYVEVGTRCRGGPGLIWMFFGSKEKAVRMKEVFYVYVRSVIVEPLNDSQAGVRYFERLTDLEDLGKDCYLPV